MSRYLQRVIDIATRCGFKMKFNRNRKKCTFTNVINQRVTIELETELYVEDGEIVVWFNCNDGMSGNDSDYAFWKSFKRMMTNADGLSL
jgi:hypothetical protein